MGTGKRLEEAPSDIILQQGIVEFPEEETSGTISLLVDDDIIPELEEVFEVEIRVLGGTPEGARVETAFSSARVEVLESDDPHGLLQVGGGSVEVLLAEETDGSVPSALEIAVERDFGTVGMVQVCTYGRTCKS